MRLSPDTRYGFVLVEWISHHKTKDLKRFVFLIAFLQYADEVESIDIFLMRLLRSSLHFDGFRGNSFIRRIRASTQHVNKLKQCSEIFVCHKNLWYSCEKVA